MDSGSSRDTHPYSDATSPYSDGHPDAYTHAQPHTDAKSDPHTQPHANAESDANTHPHPHANAASNANANADAGVHDRRGAGGTWRWRRHRGISKAHLPAEFADRNMCRSNAAGSL